MLTFESISADAIKSFPDILPCKSDHATIKGVDCTHLLPVTSAAKNMMAPLRNNNHSNKNTSNNTQQQRRPQSDDNDQNEDNTPRNTDCSGGNEGNDGNDDDKENKRDDEKQTGADNNEEDDDDDETEEEDENESECEHKKSDLNASAPQFVKPLESIDEMKPLPPDSNASVINDAPQKIAIAPNRIQISRKMTNEMVPNRVIEEYNDVYHFMNKSLIYKKNQIICKAEIGSICIINYGFHDKETEQILYCVANEQSITKRKYKWCMMDRLFTEYEIKTEFKIASDKIPLTILDDAHFSAQLTRIHRDDLCSKSSDIISKTKWQNIPIYTKRNNTERKTLNLSISRFRKKIKTFHDYNMKQIHLVPIMKITDHEQYRIEHIWVLRIEENVTIGIALQYDTKQNKIQAVGIHLNKEYLRKSHQLIPTLHDCHCLDSFQTFYDNLIIGNMDLEKENFRLRKEITELQEKQQSHITDLQLFVQKSWNSLPDPAHRSEAVQLLQASTNIVGSLASARDEPDEKHVVSEQQSIQLDTQNGDIANNPINHSIARGAMNIYTTPLYHTISNPSTPTNTTIQNYISFPMMHHVSPTISQLSNMNTINTLSLPQSCTLSYIPSLSVPNLSTICDTSMYLNTMRRQPFVANKGRQDIFIAKSLTDYYLLRTNARFRDTQRMYYYLMKSITMQIIDGFATMYNDTVAIVCCDLLDKVSGDTLYAVIMRNREVNQHRFRWKVVSLSTFNEIAYYYLHLQHCELPHSSRNTDAFRSQLNQRDIIMNKISKSMNNLKLRNKKQVKSKKQNRSKYNVDKEEIKMSEKQMKQCIIRSLHHKNAVAIIKIKGDKYWIEWIVICQIKNKRLHFGVSFRYDSDSDAVEATHIFLDGVEIEKQNQLVNVMGFCNFDLNMFMSGISKIHTV